MNLSLMSITTESPIPLYQQISTNIEKEIVEKKISVGQKLPPEEQLCKTLNVSVYTVRSALAELVKKGLLMRKQNRGTFVVSSEPKYLETRNEIATILCTGEDGTISLSARLLRIMEGIEKGVRENGAHFIFSNLSIKNSEFDFREKSTSIGGIIVSGIITREHYRIIKKLKLPFVLIGDIYQKEKTKDEVDIICLDDFQPPYIATEHLTELGHKRIVYFVLYGGRPWDKDKIDGYKHALKKANLDYDEKLLIKIGKGKEDMSFVREGHSLMKKFLEKSIPFTGFILDAGYFNSGVFQAIREKGMSIPEDISLVGLGTGHDITQVTYGLQDLGRQAVERLVERIKNPDLKPARIHVPIAYIEGNSTRQIDN